MRSIFPTGLVILLVVPLIVAIHARRRRLPVRRVAGAFLWHDSAPLTAQASGLGGWSRPALIRDVMAATGLAILASGILSAEVSETGDFAQWLAVAGRALACVATAALLLANWRQSPR